MAIPGAIMFSIAGVTGQFLSNFIDRMRIRYILEHEHEWIGTNQNKSVDTINKADDFEQKFQFLEKLGMIKKANVEDRINLLQNEIEKLDQMLKKVDDEIAKLAQANGQRK